tara:strand:+ start:261 stop:746 length:486 start_codon:yes stop_codon:yes gene_type:complete
MIKLVKIIVLICLLASCSAGRDYQRVVGAWLGRDIVATGKDYRFVLDSWVGYDINLLVRRWGNPTNIFQARNGNSIFVFGRTDYRSEPVRVYQHIFKALPDTTYTTTFKSKYGFSALPEYIALTRNGPVGEEVLNMSCETMFEVNDESSITHWSYRGYDCY